MYLLIIILLSVFYLIIFTIFGYIIFFLLDKKRTYNQTKLSNILIYLAVGISVHIFFSIILNYFLPFNFISIYLPFIIIDFTFVIYILKKKNFTLSMSKDHLKTNLKKFFLDYWPLIISIIMMFILQNYFISRSLSLASNDPYIWSKEIWYLHENGFLDYNSYDTFPNGYVYFCCTIVSFVDDYYLFYYFCKYFPLILMSINLISLHCISKSFFKKNINIFMTLVIYLSFNYSAYRYTLLVPSTLATTLVYLFLCSFELKKSIKKVEIRGIIIGGLLLCHQLYGLYILFFFFLYELLSSFKIEIKANKMRIKKIPNWKKFYLEEFYLFLIIILFVYPFILITSFRLKFNIFEYYSAFIVLKIPNFLLDNLIMTVDIVKGFYDLFINRMFYSNFIQISSPNFEKGILSIFTRFTDETLGISILVVVLGLYIPFKKHYNLKQKQINLANFIKFTFFLTFLCYVILYIIDIFFCSTILSTGINFFSRFFKRFFELFAGLWALIFSLTFIFLLRFFRKTVKKLKIIKINFQIRKKISKKITRIISISLIVSTSLFLYFNNFKRVQYFQYFQDSHTDAILFTCNHFNENPPLSDTIILIEKVNYKYYLWYTNYDLLNYPKLNKIIINFYIFSDYKGFRSFYKDTNIEYLFFNINSFNNDFNNELLTEFEIIYKNQGNWTFAKKII